MSQNNLDDQLDRYKQFIASKTEAKQVSSDLPPRYVRFARQLGGEVVSRQEGAYCLIRTFYPSGTPFGAANLESLNPVKEFSLSAFSVHESEERVKLGDLLFFDLETTGLGGVGTVPFLVGCGSVVNGGFEVRQYLLPDYSDETAVLETVLEELNPKATVVSYNGAAFDMSLIRDRMIVNRVARKVPVAGHIDLLHSVRRLFKRRLGACNLAHVEEELFQYFRDDDIPGYLIPSVYFDWLNAEDLSYMPQVLEHNRLDILALCFLIQRIAEVFETSGEALSSTDDIYSLSKVYHRRKQTDKVLGLCDRFDDFAEEAISEDIRWFHSLVLKKSGNWTEAVRLWGELAVGDNRESYLAHLELAKYYEHREKDAEKALSHTLNAKEICPASLTQKQALARRLKRLEIKKESL